MISPARLSCGLRTLVLAAAAYCGVAAADQPGVVPDPAVASVVAQLGLQESATPVRELAGWQPPKKVLFSNLNPALLPSLQAVAPGVEFVPASNAAEAAGLAGGVDVVLGFCTPEVLAAGTAIRWIQVYSAGVERCVALPALTERKILLTNMQRVAGPVMAEHVLAMMLALTRGLDFYILERAAARWTRELPPPAKMMALEGKTVLVVGLGGIGTEVAKRASSLGMRVVATRASGREGPPFVSYVGLPGELRKLAGEAHFIVNTVPLTPETERMFDAGFFAAARQGAYFINVGRGKSVVQEDLVAALKSGRIAGAGLDVTDPEPLPADHPLWKFPNVIITPHVSAQSDVDEQVRFVIVRENLRRYVAGEKMLSVVDVAKGY
jgi:phosphoglycerate dehydrogenase-like enzyme